MYSTDIAFFLAHQIGICSTKGDRQVNFFSRLENRHFKTVTSARPLTDKQIKQHCLYIFNDLMRVLKTKGVTVKHVFHECTGKLYILKILQGQDDDTIEIQLCRSGISSIFWLSKYIDVALIRDEVIFFPNWCQAYLFAKSLLNHTNIPSCTSNSFCMHQKLNRKTRVIPGQFKVHEQDHGDNVSIYQRGYITESEASRVANIAWYNSGSVKYTWISQEITYY